MQGLAVDDRYLLFQSLKLLYVLASFRLVKEETDTVLGYARPCSRCSRENPNPVGLRHMGKCFCHKNTYNLTPIECKSRWDTFLLNSKLMLSRKLVSRVTRGLLTSRASLVSSSVQWVSDV